MIEATVNIFFDFNPPIITNTATTTYVNTLGADSFVAAEISIPPNPAKEQPAITSCDNILQYQIHNILEGQILEEKNKNLINVSNLKLGVCLR